MEVIYRDGSLALFINTLLIPDLGVNLILGKRLCKSGLTGAFDAQNMYFKDKDGKTVLRA